MQETLLAAWRGLVGFEGRSSLRACCTASPRTSAGFFAQRVFATQWRAVPFVDVSGQPAIVGYLQQPDASFRRGSLIVIGLRDGRVSSVSSFLDPVLLGGLGIPEEIPR